MDGFGIEHEIMHTDLPSSPSWSEVAPSDEEYAPPSPDFNQYRSSVPRQAVDSVDRYLSILFQSGIQRPAPGPRTLVEYRMKTLSGQVRAEPNWWEKVGNEETVARWRTEMRERDRALVDKIWGGEEYWYWKHWDPEYEEQPELDATHEEHYEIGGIFPRDGNRLLGIAKQWPREPISDSQLDYILDELTYDAERVDRVTGIYPTSIYGVYASHTLIPPALIGSLLAGVGVLEDVSEGHLRSNKQVLDLVDPSLYPLRIGHSLISRGEAARGPMAFETITWTKYHAQRPDLDGFMPDNDYLVSKAFQWLPTDFKLSVNTDEQTTATPLGYINNLHPTKHSDLYPTISSILARFTPLWESVLTDVTSPIPPPAVNADPRTWYNGRPCSPCEDEGREAHDAWEREVWWPSIPEPDRFTPPAIDGRPRVTLGGRTLQVIVKLANIVLTPGNPTYSGSSWHVEGMANEKIVAIGMYHYAAENVGVNCLNFRCVVGDEGDSTYRKDDAKGYSVVFGLDADGAWEQNLGSVIAEEGKCVAFPNTYLHRVGGFELLDKTEPGRCKILYFFLVNPDTRILSTSDVLPQQEAWLVGEADKLDGMQLLPRELHDIIMHDVRVGAMTPREAAEVRKELMEERGAFMTHLRENL